MSLMKSLPGPQTYSVKQPPWLDRSSWRPQSPPDPSCSAAPHVTPTIRACVCVRAPSTTIPDPDSSHFTPSLLCCCPPAPDSPPSLSPQPTPHFIPSPDGLLLQRVNTATQLQRSREC
ncbi:hypothetical protein KIL84_021360 [Mauremys mutica]|uniref:Uncharacterized protein n=1 Tax=Mauremys mutica TaxID=74926 RepID=A0A9D4AZU2_9SAUR|nr:hypothetical protein KIL84_021360 [Mauremys mutica]